jgi:UDP-4-amino-4,6-dideoxy-N-acetyl-beta-L-altrosamine transaminase
MIPYGKQNISEEDIQSVVDVMRSDYLTQGPITPQFEKVICDYTDASYAAATINATAALHIACLSLGVKKGDIVWTSPISFVASANCAKYCGADVDFVDIDPLTYNMSAEALESKLRIAKVNGTLPKVVIPVHLSGQSCDMESIFELSKKYSFKIIEDASHAIGGSYKSKKIGSCEYSDICVFSFHPVKIITTCEGGVCTTNDKELFSKLYKLRSHGIVRSQKEMVNNTHGGWYYEQLELGFNYRLNDLQSALGISQMKRVDSFVIERHKIAKRYDFLLGDLDYIQTPYQDKNTYSSYHLYIIKVKTNQKYNRNRVFEKLRNSGVFVNIHYIPIYLQPYYSSSYKKEDFEKSNEYYSEALSLPIYPGLTEENIQHVVDTIINPINFQNIF